MAQNGFSRRSNNATRTYPGAASRLVGSPPLVAERPPTSGTTSSGGAGAGGSRSSSSSLGNVPAVFVRPLSRSQLAPMHGGIPSSGGGGLVGGGNPPSPPARPISLDQPRPNAERHRNLYLGAPLPSHHHSSPNRSSGSPVTTTNSGTTTTSTSSKNRLDSSVTAAEQVRLGGSTSSSSTISRTSKSDKNQSSQEDVIGSVVTTQPMKRGLLEESTESGKVKLAESSIVCPYCRKCRCEACTTPRPLPSRWICSKSIHCGPEPILDYMTCLCCVKALFYHCGKNHEADGGVICADKPCSCAPHRKFWRWGCMATMSLVLPCLCLYWPCKGCIHLVEKTYQRYHSNGCHCHPPNSSLNKHADDGGEELQHGLRASNDFPISRSTSLATTRSSSGGGSGGAGTGKSSKLLPSSP